MKLRTAVLLWSLLVCMGLGLCAGAGAEDLPEEPAEETVARLPDDVLMTYYDGTMFVGDSQVRKFQNYVKKTQKKVPGYFANIDFRAENSYKFRFVAYRTIPSGELKYAHLKMKGKKVTLFDIVKEQKPKRVMILAGINDALTTDYKNENGVERAMRYVRGGTELIREASPETEIFFITQMPVTSRFVQGSNRAPAVKERWDEINSAIRSESEALGIRLMDLTSGLTDEKGFLPGKLCEDGKCHLNDAGYAVFGQNLLDFAQAEYEAGRWTPEGTAETAE